MKVKKQLMIRISAVSSKSKARRARKVKSRKITGYLISSWLSRGEKFQNETNTSRQTDKCVHDTLAESGMNAGQKSARRLAASNGVSRMWNRW